MKMMKMLKKKGGKILIGNLIQKIWVEFGYWCKYSLL